MKKIILASLFTLAFMAMPAICSAHEYERNDSDHPLRLVGYVLHPLGMAVEYTILRPIHWLVSQPHCDVILGHEPREAIEYDYMEWK